MSKRLELLNELETLVKARVGDNTSHELGLVFATLWGKAMATLTQEQAETLVQFEKER